MLINKKIAASNLLLCLALSQTALAAETEINLSTRVSGNQEQPKILYIVPWQPSSSSEKLAVSVNSQLLDVFAHLEREELERQVHLRIESDLLKDGKQLSPIRLSSENTDAGTQEE